MDNVIGRGKFERRRELIRMFKEAKAETEHLNRLLHNLESNVKESRCKLDDKKE